MYLPYTAGLLQTYVATHSLDPARYHFLRPIYLRMPIEAIVPWYKDADVIGLSIHVWNCNYTLALAKKLKEQNPRALLIVGGPHVPTDAGDFLRSHPYLDAACHGHGEIALLKLLEALPSWDWQGIQGISWVDSEGHYHHQGTGERVLDINATPSPYLTGYFEPLMADHGSQKWMAVWETNRGCPFSCTFCDWGAALGAKVLRFDIERVKDEIEWFGRNKIDFLFCMDANFGILPRDLEIAEAMASTKRVHGYPLKSVMQMTKNTADRAFQAYKILNEAKMLPSAALSLQSTTPDVLKAIKRDNISLSFYQELLRRFIGAGIPTYTDILIGLPGETYDSFLENIDTIITQGQHDELRFWNTYVLPNAEMAQPAYRREHGLETLLIPYLTPYAPVRPPIAEAQESIELLVASNTMTRQDWVKMRTLAWYSQILYEETFLQMPLLLIKALTPIRHRDVLKAFFEDPLPPGCTELQKLRHFLLAKAIGMLQGQPEFTAGRDPSASIQIWLPTQGLMLNELMYHPRLDQVFAEIHSVLQHLFQRRQAELPPGLLVESLVLAQAVFRARIPSWQGFKIRLNYNLWEVYQLLRKGQSYELRTGAYSIEHRPNAEGQLSIEQCDLSLSAR